MSIRLAQLALVVSGLLLWVSSRLPWVQVSSSDGLGQPKSTVLSGAAWSTALVPLALVVLAAAIAALALRGWALRMMAGLVAVATAGMAYLGVSLWAIPDVAVRAVEVAQIPGAALLSAQPHYWGAVSTLAAAGCALTAAVLLLRAATRPRTTSSSDGKYLAPAAKRAAVRRDDAAEPMSERMIWDALDQGHDPTAADNQGR